MNLKYFDEVAQNLLNLAQSKITKQIEIKEDLKSKLYKRALQMQ